MVPDDVCAAARCETVYRALVEGVGGINGVSQAITFGDVKISTAHGALNWRTSSPVALCHDTYLECVAQYRRRMARQWARLRPGVS